MAPRVSLTLIVCILILGEGISVSAEPPAPGLVSRVAFGSCLRSHDQPIWKAVLRDRPDLFLLTGDNVYADTENPAVLRAAYKRLDALPGFAKVRRTMPLLGTWDDHDYGANDGGADYPMREESRRAFLDFFRVPEGSPRRIRDGVYDAQVFGPPGKRVQIILLDTRYFRSALRHTDSTGYLPDPDPGKTMLGDAQWKWLGEQLRLPAELRLIVSSIQVIAEESPWEKWGNLPLEQRRLYDLIRTTGAAGVVFLSGDRHAAELSQADGGVGYPLFDLTSSPLSGPVKRTFPRESNKFRVAHMDSDNNYGFIEIDWSKADPLIRLEIRDTDGDASFSKKILLSELRPYAVDRLPLLFKARPFFGFSQDGRYWHNRDIRVREVERIKLTMNDTAIADNL